MAYIGYQQVSCPTALVQTSSALTIPARATSAEIQAQDDGDINYTMDGATQPGSSRGMILKAGAAPKEVLISDLRNIRFVKDDAATYLNVHYISGRDV